MIKAMNVNQWITNTTQIKKHLKTKAVVCKDKASTPEAEKENKTEFFQKKLKGKLNFFKL